MFGAKRLLEHLANDTSESLEKIHARLDQLEEDRKDDTVLLLVLYEALYAALSDPGNPFTAQQKAREILAMLGE